MATLAQIADGLSSSPAATTRLPAAELGLLVGEREQRLSAMVAARDQAVAELGLLDQRATSLLPAIEPSAMLQVGSLRAQEIVLAANQATASVLAGLGSFEPRAALASIVAEQYDRPMREFALSMESYVQSTQAIARQFAESVRMGSLVGLSDALLSPAEMAAIVDIGQPSRLARQALEQFYADERRHEQEQQALAHFLEGEQRAASRVEREWLAGLPDVAQMVDALGARQAPAVRPGGEPPPQSGNFGTPPGQPGQPGGWQALLADALRAGQAQPDEVIRLVAQVAKLPPVAEIRAELAELENLERAWQKVKRRQTVDRFAAGQGMSRATLYRRWGRLKELRMLLQVWQ